ncbi:agmatine deiminase family protein [Pseudidiomarina homiensis]|uniref:Agmatine deiminase n=1 Tax=Pseudidiomarina homiensis TaxID=364198 RepID=A0A432Y2X5_9GAMM|nr:agmatine deiminase family protein [Pseudidiomarina homiensis]RUO55303.1 hypothetical protein CWI70_00480 [Pseudidiomarina homiensis]
MTLLADWQLQGPLLALWPYRNDVWRANARPAQQAILQLLNAVAKHHAVLLGIHPPQLQTAIPQLPDELAWAPLRYDDAWLRDSGPHFVRENFKVRAVAGEFDGWQGVHSHYQRDRRVPQQLAQCCHSVLGKLPFIFEGGMLSHDGTGTALVHAKSLQRRNPQWRLSELERQLQCALGLSRVIWIQHGLNADETGGHVDNQIQFIGADVIAFAGSQNDPLWNAEVQQLRQQPWAKKYRWLQLPESQLVYDDPTLFADVQRRPGVRARGMTGSLASYVNMIRLPEVLLVPQFSYRSCQSSNQQALALLRDALPELAVEPIDATEMIRGGGGPHCLSLVLPS